MTDHPYQAPTSICGYCNRIFCASTCDCEQQKRAHAARQRELEEAPRLGEVAVKRSSSFAFFGHSLQGGRR